MKTTRTALFALLLLGIPLAASAQLSVGVGATFGHRGHAAVDIGFFYDQLASYGNWIERPSYGWVWTPRGVSASWRPYQSGHWVWSDEGWTWLSNEPYGWATYHYGRWYQDPELGWSWVPGTQWGPAWVSWREGGDYVGWAPLPPGADVQANFDGGPGYDDGPAYDDGPYAEGPGYDDGYGYDNDRYDGGYADGAPYYNGGYYGGGYAGGGYSGGGYAYGILPSAYLFVPVRSFLSVDLFDFFLPWVRVSSFWGRTRDCTYYGYRGGHYFNRGPYDHVRRYYHNVPRYQVSELGGFRGHGYQVDGHRVAFYRPRVERTRGASPLQRPAARGSVMRADQFRAAFPDRAARAQREVAAGGQAFRGQVQGAGPERAPRGQVQGYRSQAERQRQYDTLRRNRGQVYGERRYDNRNNESQAYRQRQVETQRFNRQQVERERRYDNPQVRRQAPSYAPPRQHSAPRVRERSAQPRSYSAPRSARPDRSYSAPRSSAPRREYHAPSRGQESRGHSQGGGNGRRHGHG